MVWDVLEARLGSGTCYFHLHAAGQNWVLWYQSKSKSGWGMQFPCEPWKRKWNRWASGQSLPASYWRNLSHHFCTLWHFWTKCPKHIRWQWNRHPWGPVYGQRCTRYLLLLYFAFLLLSRDKPLVPLLYTFSPLLLPLLLLLLLSTFFLLII